MREIKFRWIDKRTGALIPDPTSTVYPDGSVGLEDPCKDLEWITFGGQYTGLKDIKGDEIYEGDNIYVLHTHHKNKDRVFTIVFLDGCFCLKSDLSGSPISLGKYKQDSLDNDVEWYEFGDLFEIIGNIHQT